MTCYVFRGLTLGLLFALAAGCGGEGEERDADSAGAPGGGSTALRGSVEIDGSSTVFPISEAVASAFRDSYPNVKVTVAISGTGGGFKRFTTGDTDISDASRPVTFKEFQAAAENGVEMIEMPVAMDGLTVAVNPKNDWVDQLTVEQIRRIYLARHNQQREMKWSDLNDDWPDETIIVYSPGTDSGTFDYFHEVMGEELALRSDMSTSEDDNVLVTGVAGDLYAVGYFGASYYYNNRDKLKAVPVVNPDTGEAVLPTESAVRNGDYAPFARPLFIYVNAQSLRRPEMKAFVDFYLDHAPAMAQQVDYVPVSDTIAERVQRFYRQRLTGTTYIDADGNKRRGSLVEIYRSENLVTSDDVQ